MMRLLLCTVVPMLLVILVHSETKELICTEVGKIDSPISTYQVVRGKKGGRGLKGFKGEHAEITEQDLEKLENELMMLEKQKTKLIDTNQCEPNPCINGQCQNKLRKYVCVCNSGFQGMNCSEDYSTCGQAGDITSLKQQIITEGNSNGSTNASSQAWPWQVILSRFRTGAPAFLMYTINNFLGGGSVINNQYVLTAAHLLFTLDTTEISKQVLITYGIHELINSLAPSLPSRVEVYTASQVHIHEQYDSRTLDYDIALVKVGTRYVQQGNDGPLVPTQLSGWVNYTEHIRPVCLPCTQNNGFARYLEQRRLVDGSETAAERCDIETREILQSGSDENMALAVLTGFGSIEKRSVEDTTPVRISQILQQGWLRLHEQAYCEIFSHFGQVLSLPQQITTNMFCATNDNNFCQGFSGSPLVKEVTYNDDEQRKSFWVQGGILSWGFECGQTTTIDGNNGIKVPEFFTNLMTSMTWVKNITNLN